MSPSREALTRWWRTLSVDDQAHLRSAATTNSVDARARALLGGKGALWAVYDTYFRRDSTTRGARLAENLRRFILEQGSPGKDG